MLREDDMLAGLVAALAEVAENSLFAFSDATDRETFLDGVSSLDDATGAHATWIRAAVTFGGDAAGVVELVLPTTLARELCTAFAGEEDPAAITDDAVYDFAGELTNMVCGLWLTRASRERLFDLRQPQVASCAPPTPHDVDGAPHRGRCGFAAVNDVPILVQARLHARAGAHA